jgi:hypothetical protein
MASAMLFMDSFSFLPAGHDRGDPAFIAVLSRQAIADPLGFVKSLAKACRLSWFPVEDPGDDASEQEAEIGQGHRQQERAVEQAGVVDGGQAEQAGHR